MSSTTTNPEIIISLDSVKKSFHAYGATLSDISFDIQKGSWCTIMGPSGAGKTTLLHLMYGIHKPSSGSIRVAGTEVSSASRKEIQALRRKMGFVFQDFRLIDHWSAYQNICVVLEMLRLPRSYIRTRVWKVLEWVGLQHRAYDNAGLLSGGERQRLALARAIVHGPDLLVADEPLSSVDPGTARDVLGLLYRLNMRGVTVVLASHGNTHLMEGTQIYELEQGSIKACH